MQETKRLLMLMVEESLTAYEQADDGTAGLLEVKETLRDLELTLHEARRRIDAKLYPSDGA